MIWLTLFYISNLYFFKKEKELLGNLDVKDQKNPVINLFEILISLRAIFLIIVSLSILKTFYSKGLIDGISHIILNYSFSFYVGLILSCSLFLILYFIKKFFDIKAEF